MRPPSMRPAALLLAIMLPLLAGAPARAGTVLDHVRQAGALTCGLLTPPSDYTRDDTHGAVPAFGAEICKAVAVAILGADARIAQRGYPDEQHGFAAVQSGAVDLLLGASPSLYGEQHFALAFGPPVFFDGQSYLVARQSGIASVRDLAGKHLCFIGGTESEAATEAVLARRGIGYLPFPQQEDGEMQAALVGGACTAMAGSITQLANARAGFKGRRNDFVILPDPITIDPIAPAYAAADAQFGAIVKWTVAMLVQAEQSGLTRQDAATETATDAPDLRAIEGIDPTVALALGLRRDWAMDVVRAVGNYGELFDRTLGDGSGLGIARGASALWSHGGAMVPPPAR